MKAFTAARLMSFGTAMSRHTSSNCKQRLAGKEELRLVISVTHACKQSMEFGWTRKKDTEEMVEARLPKTAMEAPDSAVMLQIPGEWMLLLLR